MVERLRNIIARVAPDWRESIGRKMLRFTGPMGMALHLNAQKGYVALYCWQRSRAGSRRHAVGRD